MKRENLEHLVRASAAITDESAIVVVGSQSILGTFPNAPAELLISNEADLYPRHAPEKSDLIDGVLGEGSYFDRTFGYYAQGVDETTSILPVGWKGRLVKIKFGEQNDITAYCLDPLDLACAKLVANRPKDLSFISIMLTANLVTTEQIRERLKLLPKLDSVALPHKPIHSILQWLDGWDKNHYLKIPKF